MLAVNVTDLLFRQPDGQYSRKHVDVVYLWKGPLIGLALLLKNRELGNKQTSRWEGASVSAVRLEPLGTVSYGFG